MPHIQVVQLPHGEGLPLPDYRTVGAAGMDLMAAIADDEPMVFEPGERKVVPTGLTMAIPQGYEGQVRPRSGLALKSGMTCLNAPGTIDWDYRGEIGVIMINHGSTPYEMRRGDRIAQLVVAPVAAATLVRAETLEETGRGTGGFGSTGRS